MMAIIKQEMQQRIDQCLQQSTTYGVNLIITHELHIISRRWASYRHRRQQSVSHPVTALLDSTRLVFFSSSFWLSTAVAAVSCALCVVDEDDAWSKDKDKDGTTRGRRTLDADEAQVYLYVYIRSLSC